MRVVDEGLSTGGKPEVELTGAVSDMSADVLEACSNFSSFFARRRVRFSDLDAAAFEALKSRGAGSN